MKLMTTIKCSNCSAPSYSDLKKEGFYCHFCGTLLLWSNLNRPFSLGIHFRHKPVGMEDGCYKLGMAMVYPPFMNIYDEEESRERRSCLDSKIAFFNSATYEKWTKREYISSTCETCGSFVGGFSNQSIFECSNCGTKIADSKLISGGKYDKEFVIGRDNNELPSLALPYRINLEKAKKAVMNLAGEEPEIFSGQEVLKHINDLIPVYLPHRPADLECLAQAETEEGIVLFYHGRTNWALPLSYYIDRYLVNALHPWDFLQASPFRPTFLEGDVRIVAKGKNETHEIRSKILLRDLEPLVKKNFEVSHSHILWVQHDTRLHKYANLMMPIYFLDRIPLNCADSSYTNARFAVNGQTGKAACIINAGEKNEIIIEKNDPFAPALSDESTLYSPLIPVKKRLDRTFQFRPVPLKSEVIPKK